MRRIAVVSLFLFLSGFSVVRGADVVGPTTQGGIVLPNSQFIRPAGHTVTYSGRPLDMAWCRRHSAAIVKNTTGLTLLDGATWRVVQSLRYDSEGGSMHGIAIANDDTPDVHVYVTGSHNTLLEATFTENGELQWGRRIALPKAADNDEHARRYVHALGVAVTSDGAVAYVCLSRNNSLAIIDLKEGNVTGEIPVGVCPYAVVLSPDASRAYVTNFGGHRPRAGAATALSAGTSVEVDRRGIADSGTMSIVDLRQRQVLKEIDVGLHPCDAVITHDGSRVYVANANSDSISVIDTAAAQAIETINVRPDPNLPVGSIPNGLALGPDDRMLYCACGGNNAVACVALGAATGARRVNGFIPAGWFPGAVAVDGKNLLIVNVKGEGARYSNPLELAWNSRRYLGSVTRVPVPAAAELAKLTAQVNQDAHIPQALAALELARGDRPPMPVPQRTGEPSRFQHVIYVLKENRTYDQIFGDIAKGNSDPLLCIFGRQITPNQHALAEQFVLLDNYYCNGAVSADGHQWATQGMVTDYQEKDLTGGSRSYDFGTDALCYAACDFLWDTALLHGLSFRNYGEFDFPILPPESKTWFDVNRQWHKTGTIAFRQSIELAPLKPYTCPEYPGWMLKIPDAYRIEAFLKELMDFEKRGDMPNLLFVYLPQDHTEGTKQSAPSPRAFVADNDLAVGRLVDAVSHGKFWATTCIFVNEDDPQNGFDHVDGHRSTCLVISPYTKRAQVISRFYNQSGVLHTICRILGLPPMNQMVALSPTMEECFNATPDLTPFTSLPSNIAIDEPNKPRPPQTRPAAEAAMDFSRPDRVDDDLFNRILWHAQRPNEPYPAALAGAHGKGLKKLSLKLLKAKDDDDDDK